MALCLLQYRHRPSSNVPRFAAVNASAEADEEGVHRHECSSAPNCFVGEKVYLSIK
jgi:hypothetical protein